MPRRNGYTLVELLAVVIVLAVIVVIIATVSYIAGFGGTPSHAPITHSYVREGHYYISFPSGVVHDPDCPCHTPAKAEKE